MPNKTKAAAPEKGDGRERLRALKGEETSAFRESGPLALTFHRIRHCPAVRFDGILATLGEFRSFSPDHPVEPVVERRNRLHDIVESWDVLPIEHSFRHIQIILPVFFEYFGRRDDIECSRSFGVIVDTVNPIEKEPVLDYRSEERIVFQNDVVVSTLAQHVYVVQMAGHSAGSDFTL